MTTDSYDAAGTVISEAPVPELSRAEIQDYLSGFLGPQQQIPPMVSAISIGGKRLYELARQGIEVERAPRSVEFYQIDLLRWESPWLEIEVSCSAGTYIRSLAHDLGQQIGCGASLQTLCRTRAHAFTLEQAMSLDSLVPIHESAEQGLPADCPLQHLPAVTLAHEHAIRALRLGQSLNQQSITDLSSQLSPETDFVRIYTPDGEFAALGQVKTQAQPDAKQPEEILIRPKLLLLDPITEKSTSLSL